MQYDHTHDHWKRQSEGQHILYHTLLIFADSPSNLTGAGSLSPIQSDRTQSCDSKKFLCSIRDHSRKADRIKHKFDLSRPSGAFDVVESEGCARSEDGAESLPVRTRCPVCKSPGSAGTQVGCFVESKYDENAMVRCVDVCFGDREQPRLRNQHQENSWLSDGAGYTSVRPLFECVPDCLAHAILQCVEGKLSLELNKAKSIAVVRVVLIASESPSDIGSILRWQCAKRTQ